MNKENLKIRENTQDAREVEKSIDVFEYNYQHYLELGGIINKADYEDAINRLNNTQTLDGHDSSVRSSIAQAEAMAEYVGIKLGNSGNSSDPDRRIVLYVLLRLDTKPEDVEHHHEQMSDQQIFAEVLRIFGDTDSLDKLIKSHPNISFEYNKDR